MQNHRVFIAFWEIVLTAFSLMWALGNDREMIKFFFIEMSCSKTWDCSSQIEKINILLKTTEWSMVFKFYIAALF